MRETMTIKSADDIFRLYISRGIFSRYRGFDDYAGNYKYRGSIGGVDLFQHVYTKEFIRFPEDTESWLLSEKLKENIKSN